MDLRRFPIALAILGLPLVGCAPTRMWVDDSLKPDSTQMLATQVPEKNGEGNLTFGDYKATNITVKGGASSSGVKIGGYGKITRKVDQDIGFKFTGGKSAAVYNVECKKNATSDDESFNDNAKFSYNCKATTEGAKKETLAFQIGSESGGSKMGVGFRDAPVEFGKIEGTKNGVVEIKSTTIAAKEDGAKGGPTGHTLGYTFTKGTNVIAAAETTSQYSLWVKKDVPEPLKDHVALAAAALQIHHRVGVR